MSEYKIHAGLDKKLNDAALGSVKWPNRKFTKTIGTPFYLAHFLPNKPRQSTLGTTGTNRITGIYQVTIKGEVDKGKKPIEDRAEAVVTLFKRGTSITYVGVVIRIESAYYTTREEDQYFTAIVNIAWRSDYPNP